ncbi:hypothetical protein PSTT_14696, partial [Puccinia striiformis]
LTMANCKIEILESWRRDCDIAIGSTASEVQDHDVKPSMKIHREEIFGPAVVVMKFVDEEDTYSGWINCYNKIATQVTFGGVEQSGLGRESVFINLSQKLQSSWNKDSSLLLAYILPKGMSSCDRCLGNQMVLTEERSTRNPDHWKPVKKVKRQEEPAATTMDSARHLHSPAGSFRIDKTYPNLMPYPIESLDQMDTHLELIIQHLLEAAQAKDFELAFTYWQQVLERWLDFRYPIKRRLRARLASLFFNLTVSPGMDPDCVARMAKLLIILIKSDKYLDVRDLQLDWKALYDILKRELAPKQRASGLTTIYLTYLELAEVANAYFPPHTTMEILETILPELSGQDINSVLSTQSLLCVFLPISHPVPWLDSIFRLWNTFQSQSWDSQWLDLLARLSHKHLDPNASDPRLEHILKNITPGQDFDEQAHKAWSGIHRDVGIYTQRQWSFIMTQCIRYFSVPVGSNTVQAAATYSAKVTDIKVSSRILKMLKPSDTLNRIDDRGSESGDCRALTSLSKLLTAMETFFHPSNYGRWSSKLAKFLNYLAKQFARRWVSESKIEQNTPNHWKLTASIKKDLS